MSDKPIRTASTEKLTNSILAGMPKLPPALTALGVSGKTYSMTDLQTQLEVYKAAFDAAAKARADAAAADEAVQKLAPTAVPFVAAVRDAFKAALGKKSVALETVGVTPNKTPAPLTPEKEVAKVAKAKATRIARHTMGKNQKAAIKGQVPPPKAGP